MEHFVLVEFILHIVTWSLFMWQYPSHYVFETNAELGWSQNTSETCSGWGHHSDYRGIGMVIMVLQKVEIKLNGRGYQMLIVSSCMDLMIWLNNLLNMYFSFLISFLLVLLFGYWGSFYMYRTDRIFVWDYTLLLIFWWVVVTSPFVIILQNI